MSRQDLDGIWTVLGSSLPPAGVAAAPTGYEVTAGPVLAGVDSEGRRHFLIPLVPGEAARTDTRGRAVQLTRIAHAGTHYVTVLCLLPELHSVFSRFCRELADTIESANSPAREAATAFDRWRALFAFADVGVSLTDEMLTGLIGELLVVGRLLDLGAPADLRFWVGPFNAVHDIRSRTHAIEVKTTLAREGRIVPISSIDQLQQPENADLVLLHIRLDLDPGGLNLSDTVDKVLAAGAQHDELNARLREFRLSAHDLGSYATKRYRVSDDRAYDVSSTAFPRLVRSSFTTGDIPAGTLRVSYSIDLTNQPPSPLSDESLESALTALASEANDEMDP